MPRMLPLAPSVVLTGMLLAAPAFAGEGWDHRAMQSHHRAADRAERPLAPGERRVGRIEIGVAAPSNAKMPETLSHTTQRQWIQRSTFPDSPSVSGFDAPRIQAGRHNGARGNSQSAGR